MQSVVLVLISLSQLIGLAFCSNIMAAEGARPNIVLVMADDLGWSDIGCYGGEIRTPNIDSLAKDGLRFTQFYNNSVCGPTRASLLTGLYCQQTGHRGDHWNQPKDYTKCVLVSELLQQAGYRTMMTGKWQGRDSALDRGFDRFFGPMCQGKISYFHEVEKNPFYLDRQRFALPNDFYLTEAINDHALQFLKEAVVKEEPFFLYVAHIAPHWPLHAHEQDIAAYRQQYQEQGWDEWRLRRFDLQRKKQIVPLQWKLSPRPASVWDWKTDPNQVWQSERMAAYAAQVQGIDQGIGQLLKVLKETGQEDNTLFLFLSDNGAAPDGGVGPSKNGFGFAPNQPNNRWRKDNVSIRPGSSPQNPPGPHDTFAAYGLAWANLSNTPLRGTKLTGYEGGIRTPLIAKWPKVIGGGLQTTQVGHVIDIMATCLNIADVEYPTEFQSRKPLPLEGKSLLPVFQGENRQGHKALCWSVPNNHAIRMGKWKAIRSRKDGEWQLYDLEADGTETVDLAKSEPQRVQDLVRHFEEWQKRVGDKQ
ncbi:arylsulfatase [Rubinisphaera italica]|uniref:Arylsulfatase n=1 Tax=Rubinisphaera italica TaxID=2527969 RepID=A0A5C5XDC2_9PLAN|nr:arylsulfatase [Rubinisphaera italica]TWT60619.1 Arylsulfatase [Rubinisphaera italica]